MAEVNTHVRLGSLWGLTSAPHPRGALVVRQFSSGVTSSGKIGLHQ